MHGRRLRGRAGPRSRDKISLYHCNYCQKDISGVIHIKCAICPNFDLCLECFSVGVEVTPHKRDHAYRVADNLSFPVYEPTWGADEEQLLLEAVDKFGPGNWAAIADDVGTKSLEECKRHYFAVYIDHDDFPNPKASKEMVEYEVTAARDAFGRQAVLKTPQKDTPAAAEGKAAEAEGIAGGSAQVKSEPEDKDTAMPDAPSEGPHEGDDPSATKLAPKILAGDPAALHEANAQKAKLHSKASTSGVDVKPAQGDTRTPTKPPLPPHSLNVNALTPHPRAPPHPITQSGSVADLGGKTDFTVGDNTVEVTGYHKKRDEFDPEYDNEAELMVSELEFPKNETEAERKLKLRLLDIYNMRLDERGPAQGVHPGARPAQREGTAGGREEAGAGGGHAAQPATSVCAVPQRVGARAHGGGAGAGAQPAHAHRGAKGVPARGRAQTRRRGCV